MKPKAYWIVLASTLLASPVSASEQESDQGSNHDSERAALVAMLKQADGDYQKQRYAQCAEAYLDVALRNAGARAVAGYNAACCFALQGNRDSAFVALLEAMRGGFADADHLSKDRDLISLRKDPRWAPLVHRLRNRPARNEALRKTLVKLGEDDQAEAQRSFQPGEPPQGQSAQRQALLRQIIAEHGWPGVSLVGADGAAGAWIVAQHADDDVGFQRACLDLLEPAYHNGEVPGLHLAYLTDRVRSNQRKPQIYGTQGAGHYSEAETAQINARRKQLGLPSMAEMARKKGRFYERVYREARGK
jgi:hypothetical protein